MEESSPLLLNLDFGLLFTNSPARKLLLLTYQKTIFKRDLHEYASYSDNYDKDDAIVILNLSYFCFAVDLVGLFCGSSIFLAKVNVLHIILHFLGGLWISWFVGECPCPLRGYVNLLEM